MSYIGKEITTDTVEGGDHLLLFGLFTKLSKAARVHPRHGVAAVTTSVGMSARQVASMRDAKPGQRLECGPARRGRRPPVPRAETAQGPERVDLVLAGRFGHPRGPETSCVYRSNGPIEPALRDIASAGYTDVDVVAVALARRN